VVDSTEHVFRSTAEESLGALRFGEGRDQIVPVPTNSLESSRHVPQQPAPNDARIAQPPAQRGHRNQHRHDPNDQQHRGRELTDCRLGRSKQSRRSADEPARTAGNQDEHQGNAPYLGEQDKQVPHRPDPDR
jgi:hypothetical protein